MSVEAPSAPSSTGSISASAADELVAALEELTRAQREAAARIARELDWPRAGLGVVRLLRKCGPVQLSDVAGRLRVDMSVASRQVSALVDAGLVRRTVDDDDRRARTLELTDEGRALADESVEHFGALVAQTFEGWSPGELEQAAHHLRRVAAAIIRPEKEDSHTR